MCLAAAAAVGPLSVPLDTRAAAGRGAGSGEALSLTREAYAAARAAFEAAAGRAPQWMLRAPQWMLRAP
eukprot:7664011-Pyramimonas_sp.AAC.1